MDAFRVVASSRMWRNLEAMMGSNVPTKLKLKLNQKLDQKLNMALQLKGKRGFSYSAGNFTHASLPLNRHAISLLVLLSGATTLYLV